MRKLLVLVCLVGLCFGAKLEDNIEACDVKGDVKACVSALNSYIFLRNDPTKIFEYAQKACDLDSSSGCMVVGNYYFSGSVVKQDLDTAYKYFKKGCFELASKDPFWSIIACAAAGSAYRFGNRGRNKDIENGKDIEKALEFYEEGCKQSKSLGMEGNCKAYDDIKRKGK
jgi:TPR repeat protein